jgi:hypothetical protein
MPVDNGVESTLESVDINRACEPPCPGYIVRNAAGRKLFEQPKLLLTKRRRRCATIGDPWDRFFQACGLAEAGVEQRPPGRRKFREPVKPRKASYYYYLMQCLPSFMFST